MSEETNNVLSLMYDDFKNSDFNKKLEELEDFSKLIGVIGKVYSFGVKTKMNYFLMALTNNIDPAKLTAYIEEFGDKDILQTIIEKQLRSNHKTGNAICGLIVRKGLKNNNINNDMINEIDFILSLNEIDIKNYKQICKMLKSKESKDDEDILTFDEIKHIDLVQGTIQKMNIYSYNDFNKYASVGGGINSNSRTTTIYDNYLIYLNEIMEE